MADEEKEKKNRSSKAKNEKKKSCAVVLIRIRRNTVRWHTYFPHFLLFLSHFFFITNFHTDRSWINCIAPLDYMWTTLADISWLERKTAVANFYGWWQFFPFSNSIEIFRFSDVFFFLAYRLPHFFFFGFLIMNHLFTTEKYIDFVISSCECRKNQQRVSNCSSKSRIYSRASDLH